MPERDLLDFALDAAAKFGWFAYHTFDSRRSSGGFPDLVLVRRGRLIFAELKRERENPRPDQQAWLDLLSGVPAVDVHVWRPSDCDLIIEVLR